MGSKKRKRLEATVAAIQRRWGQKALQRGQQVASGSTVTGLAIPTGFPDLDRALDGSGGIPRGRITEILGAPTSGMATLALKIISQAQAQYPHTAYVDLNGTFDPDYATRCGVKLEQLLLVRPHSGLEALEITYSLLAGRGVGLVVFNAVTSLLADPAGSQALSTAFSQLLAPLARSACALIFLTPLQFGPAMSTANYPAGLALPHFATLRLQLKKERWLRRGQDVRGYRARVHVLKNKLGRAGQQATIAITFNGVVQGDGT